MSKIKLSLPGTPLLDAVRRAFRVAPGLDSVFDGVFANADREKGLHSMTIFSERGVVSDALRGATAVTSPSMQRTADHWKRGKGVTHRRVMGLMVLLTKMVSTE